MLCLPRRGVGHQGSTRDVTLTSPPARASRRRYDPVSSSSDSRRPPICAGDRAPLRVHGDRSAVPTTSNGLPGVERCGAAGLAAWQRCPFACGFEAGRLMFAGTRLVNRLPRRSDSGSFEFHCPDRAAHRAVLGRGTTLSGAPDTGDPTNPTENMSASFRRRNPN